MAGISHTELGTQQTSDSEQELTIDANGRLELKDNDKLPKITNPEDVENIDYKNPLKPTIYLVQAIGRRLPNCRYMYVNGSMWTRINKDYQLRTHLEQQDITCIRRKK